MKSFIKSKFLSIKSGLLIFSLIPTFVLMTVISLIVSYNNCQKIISRAENNFSKAVLEINSVMEQALNFSTNTVSNSNILSLFDEVKSDMRTNYDTFTSLRMFFSNYYENDAASRRNITIFHNNYTMYRSSFSDYIDNLNPELVNQLKTHSSKDILWTEDDSFIYLYKTASGTKHTIITRYSISKNEINSILNKFDVLSNDVSKFKNKIVFSDSDGDSPLIFTRSLINNQSISLVIPIRLMLYTYINYFSVFFAFYLLLASILILFSNLFAAKFKVRLTGFVDSIADNKSLRKININTLENDKVLTPIYNKIINLISEINELNAKNVQISEEKKLIELKYVQSQFNPHLLYNSLSVLKWECSSYDSSLVDAIDSMADYYRACISDYNEVINISEEIELVRKYLSLMGFVHKRAYSFIMRIDEDIMCMKAPKHILQPFVENSILHGIQQKPEGYIKIEGTLENGFAVLRVIDNGSGISEERMKEIKKADYFSKYKSYGIKNTFERIKLFYGDTCKFDIESNNGTVITLTIPFNK